MIYQINQKGLKPEYGVSPFGISEKSFVGYFLY